MKWIWVRHGETEMNRQGRYLGHLDPPLNEHGRQQARNLRAIVQQWQPTKVYSSDLLRCVQTAEIVGSPLRVETSTALRELNFGTWDGRRYDELMQTDGPTLTAWIDDPFTLAPPGGETLLKLGKRVDDWVAGMLAASRSDDVALVVTHGGPLRWLLSHWLYGDARRFWEAPGVAHGGGVIIRWDGQRWGQPQMLEEG
ncbi:hypothetical protein BEP19_03650 [Ammoniphilus oxalaticus]|uniref:Alpha-ribazole phosphatase n=1 Tax=Ammoniphilus oxalaticus TaxID=66863 RepID=A0A419SLI0_9BACL|nr:histidine phosphatase family protein [Ammoniphilus oxalaticus]RKD24943.1 hypothetical protein BEP19_03650 [Ammoniphilus oxalaticus]